VSLRVKKNLSDALATSRDTGLSVKFANLLKTKEPTWIKQMKEKRDKNGTVEKKPM
jgi:hypothetical protein